MKKFIFIIILFYCLCLDCALLQDQTKKDITEISKGVVKIIRGKDQPLDIGTGIVIGLESNRLYILTASHVVKDKKKVKVRFSFRDKSYSLTKDKSYKGKVINRTKLRKKPPKRTDPYLDIAVVSVELPSKGFPIKSFPEIGIGHTSQIIPLNKVTSICYFDVEIFSGDSQVQTKSLEKKFCITRVSISPGCSGSPVFDERENILGIITFIDSMGAVATKIEVILKRLEKWNIPTNLLTTSQSCYVTVKSTPADAEIRINNKSKGRTPKDIRLLSGRHYDLKIIKPCYTNYFGSINCDTKDFRVKLKEILRPSPSPKPFKSLGSDIIVMKGKTLAINETFKYSTDCNKYWICFIDEEMIWPKVEITEPKFEKTVTIPSSGFTGGKLVLVCVLSEDSQKFKRKLDKRSDNPLLRPKNFNIILQTKINIQ